MALTKALIDDASSEADDDDGYHVMVPSIVVLIRPTTYTGCSQGEPRPTIYRGLCVLWVPGRCDSL